MPVLLKVGKNLMATTAPLIRAANVLPLVRFMDMNRLDTAKYLANSDLSYWFFLSPLAPVPVLNGIHLLHELARDQGADVGTKIVQQSSVAELAFIGGVALGSHTPAEALGRIAFAMPLHSTHENFRILNGQENVTLENSFKMRIDPESQHAVQIMLLSMLQQLCRFTALKPPFYSRIEAVPHPVEGLSMIEKHFGSDVVASDKPVLRVTFNEGAIQTPFIKVARDRSKTIDPSKIAPLAEDATLGGSIRPIIDAMLHDGEPTIGRVAFAAGMPVRTLQRRLTAENTSFSDQLDIVRRQLAIRVVGHEDAELQEITARLGYSSPSAFTRAVRRLTGQTPSQLRTASST